MRSPEKVIVRPLLTEKGTRLKETGGASEPLPSSESIRPKLLFEVARNANKVEIRHAVEKLWNVAVVDVRTSVVRGKRKRLGRFIGQRSDWKRAIVTLASGQNIELFEGI